MQSLANCQIKYNTFKSTTQHRNITPAELLVLVTQFHGPAGGDPVDRLKEIPADAETKEIKKLQEALNGYEQKLEETDNEELTPEIRARREQALQTKINALTEQIQAQANVIQLRNLRPEQERARVIGKYGKKLVETLFTGAIPVLPESFKHALTLGLGTEMPQEGFMEKAIFLTEGKAQGEMATA